ncbi:choice-of-anchor M domain-containing protein, partial [Conexibacter stalactiti]
MTRTARIAALVLLALAVPTGTASAQRAVADETAYLAPRLDADGQLELGLIHGRHDGSGDRWTALADAVVHTRGGAQTTVPAWAPDVGLTLFGTTGSVFWQTADNSLPDDGAARGTVRFGWTRELLYGQLASAAAVGTIRGVTTPPGGRVAVYGLGRPAPEADPTTALVSLDSDGIAAASSFSFWRQGAGARNRTRMALTWGFTQAGYHCLDLEVRATLLSGRQVYAREPLTLAVGAADPQLAPPCADAGGETQLQLTSSAGGPVQAGDPLTFTAAVGPPVAGAIQFYDDDGSGSEQALGAAVAVQDGTATLTTSALRRGVHTIRAVFTPTDGAAHAASSATLRRVRIFAPGAYVLETAAGESVHADLAVRSLGDALELGLDVDGGGARWQPLDEAIVVVPERARAAIPAGYELVGPAGGDAWTIPLSQVAGIPWLGVSSERLDASRFQRYTALRLDAVAGIDGGPPPGEVVLWDAGDGSKPFFSTRIGLPDGVRMLAGANHWHASWSFTAPGVYCLAFGAANRVAGSGSAVGDAQVLTVVVGDAIDPYQLDSCPQAGVAPTATHRRSPQVAARGGAVVVADSESGSAKRFYDVVPRLAGGALDVALLDGSPLGPGIARDLDDVVLRVGPSARTSLSAADPRLPWLGAAGAPLWEVDEDVTRAGYVLGWDTTKLDPAALDGDLSWRLTGVEGPGAFLLSDEWGERHRAALLSSRAAAGSERVELWPERRDRASWAFTAAGVYCVGFEWTGRRADGEPVAARRVVTFLVGDGDPTVVVPCGRGGRASGPPPHDDGGAVKPPPGDGQVAAPPGDGQVAAPPGQRPPLDG